MSPKVMDEIFPIIGFQGIFDFYYEVLPQSQMIRTVDKYLISLALRIGLSNH